MTSGEPSVFGELTGPHLLARFPDLDMDHLPLGTGPTPVRRLESLDLATEVWLKDDSEFGDGPWGGNKVRKLEWIIPEAHRRGQRTIFTVGGIGTHWGLAAALYGGEHGLRTVLGLVEQPVDDHVRDQLRRLKASGARVHRYPSVRRLKLAAPWLIARYTHHNRLPWYLPAGGSNPVGTLAYVECALEIASQVEAGDLPEPATVVTAVGSGGTAAGLTLGLRLAGLRSKVLAVVVNDSFTLNAFTVARLASSTAALLRRRGAGPLPWITPDALSARDDWLGRTYGDPTPSSVAAVELARREGLELEPVYTGKALAAVRDLDRRGELDGPVLWLNTHGPR